MKKLHLTAAALLLASSTAAFAQGYSEQGYNEQGYDGVQSNVVGGVAGGVNDVVGGVGNTVGGILAVPGQVFAGRSAYEGARYGQGPRYETQTSCSAIGGGAVGTCSSAR